MEEFMAVFEQQARERDAQRRRYDLAVFEQQAPPAQQRYGVAARQADPVPLVEQEQDTEVSDRYFNRQEALRIAFENVKGDWQEALRAAREILVFLQEA